MSVVSDDHAHESYNVENYVPSFLSSSSNELKRVVRYFSPEEVEQHNKKYCNCNNNKEEDDSDQVDSLSSSTSFSYWAVIDGFVVDSTDYINKHPGGKKKLLMTNDPTTGSTGKPYTFSFSKGRNAHFPETARIFRDAVQQFLEDGNASGEVVFPRTYKNQPNGKLIILGRLKTTD